MPTTNIYIYIYIYIYKPFFGFPTSSAYLNTFQKWLYDFEIHLFTPRATEGLIHNYYKRMETFTDAQEGNTIIII